MPDTTGDRSLTGRRGEAHRLGLCYTMLLGELTIYSRLHAARWRRSEAQSSKGLAIPLLFWHSAVQSTYDTPFPFDTNACICSVAPCLRVLWMSTHGCFAPPFPLSIPDCCDQTLESRSQTPLSMRTTTTHEVPTTTCNPLTATRSSLGGSQVGGLRLFRSVSQFVLAFLRQTCLTYVCTHILLLPLTLVYSSLCIRALKDPGL